MRVRKNGKVITLTESDLMRITRKVLKEQEETKKSKGEIILTDSMLKIAGGMEKFKNLINKLADTEGTGVMKIQTDEKGDYIAGENMSGWASSSMGCDGVFGATPSVDQEYCSTLTTDDKKSLSNFIKLFLDMGFLRLDPSSSVREVTHVGAKLKPKKVYLTKQKEDIK